MDYDVGYRVTCDQEDLQFDALIRYAEIMVDKNNEIVNITVEVEE